MWSPPKDWEKRPVAVLGGGVLGMRIAAAWTATGYDVTIRDPNAEQRDKALKYIEANLTAFTTIIRRKPGKVSATEDLEAAVKTVWLVFEAVPEKLAIKESTFADLEKYAPDDALLCTNSSSYKSSEMLGKLADPTKKRVLNTHYMMPPDNMVVELMTDGHTEPAIFDFLSERHQEAGFHPVVALKESTGFVFNRIWTAIKREVISVIAEGVSTPEAIDRVFVEMYSGNKRGPCRMMDQVGLDTVEFIEEHYVKERGYLPSTNLDFLQENYIKTGKLGNKTPEKGGWYPPATATKSGSRILVLDSGLAEPMSIHTIPEMMKLGRIFELSSEGPQHPVELLSGQCLPDGLDYLESNSHLYWTCMGVPSTNDGAVYGAKLGPNGLEGKIQTVVKSGDVHTPKQMAIDQQAKKIYFCDREGIRVMRVNCDGSNLEIIVQRGDWTHDSEGKDQHNWCVGITVAPKLGKFFWTQKGSSKAMQGRIFSANIEMTSGENASSRSDIQIVMDSLPEPIDLEFDEASETLYWTDRGELPLGNTLNKKYMPGGVSDRGGLGKGHEILAQGFAETIGLRVDYEIHVAYVADLGGHLWKVPLDGSGSKMKEKLWERATGSFTGVTIIKN